MAALASLPKPLGWARIDADAPRVHGSGFTRQATEPRRGLPHSMDVAALAISILSLGVAGLAFRRRVVEFKKSGPQVTVSLGACHYFDMGPQPVGFAQVVALKDGRLAVQVITVMIRFPVSYTHL